MCLRAETLELLTAVREDVVRVEAGEPRLRREPDQRGLRKDSQAREVQVECRPLLGREVRRPVDVHVADPDVA